MPTSTFPIINLWKLSCHSNETTLAKTIKKQFMKRLMLSIGAVCEIWKESASEERSFEYVDGWTTDACLYYKLTYEPSAQVS